MPLHPTLALAVRTLGGFREIARHSDRRKKMWGFANSREIQAQLEILYEMTARQRRGANDIPGEDHARAHQLNRAIHISETERTDPISQKKSELGKAVIDRGIFCSLHQEAGLHRPLKFA